MQMSWKMIKRHRNQSSFFWFVHNRTGRRHQTLFFAPGRTILRHMMLRVEGLIAAVFTPVKENGALNLDVIDRYVDHLVSQGVLNVFVGGSSGEGASFSLAERKQLTEKWVTAGSGKLQNVIVHVGGVSIPDSQDLARHAESVGVQGISTLPTVVFKPKNAAMVAEHLKMLYDAAPNTALLYYHLPDYTGVNIKIEDMVNAVEKLGVPTFSGVKFTGGDLRDLRRSIKLFGDKYVFAYGCDEQMLCVLPLGCKTFIGSTYNYAGRLYNKLIDAYKNGDMETALKLLDKSQSLVGVLFAHSFDAGINKQVMSLVSGIDMGPPRHPIVYRSAAEMKQVRGELEEGGFFNGIY
ncbi:PREDICTED: N-acetylneuraminate lyase-like isoform X1 [Branchiostoma belcheri]|uniref:N-acetylneuraminate lyase n=1 Tax=Branchiostoma belcheri TaxID=7741 RepID=A0A6P4YPR7_BRABE|nr:PREDICTED: N-acetylneuraminate lyase-like isoform X1 [Branchiostoma belcheri]